MTAGWATSCSRQPSSQCCYSANLALAMPLLHSDKPLSLSLIPCCSKQTTRSSDISVPAGSPMIGSPLDSLPAVPRSDHARSLFPGVGQSWEERQHQVSYTASAHSTVVSMLLITSNAANLPEAPMPNKTFLYQQLTST